jgi:hypothetical protein
MYQSFQSYQILYSNLRVYLDIQCILGYPLVHYAVCGLSVFDFKFPVSNDKVGKQRFTGFC